VIQTLLACLGIGLGLLGLGLGAWRLRRVRALPFGIVCRATAVASIVASEAPLAMAAFLLGSIIRGAPCPKVVALHHGVRYERLVQADPRPVVAHLVAVDLRAGHRWVVTSPMATHDGPRAVARTTTDALGILGADIAINGSFFSSMSGQSCPGLLSAFGRSHRSCGHGGWVRKTIRRS